MEKEKIPAGFAAAIVKSVQSGDSVVLVSARNYSQTKLVSLALLSTPRLKSIKNNKKEEPYAFEAREVLRRAIVGKEIIYRVEYTITALARDFCTMKIKTNEGYVNVMKFILEMGFGKLKEERRMTSAADENLFKELELLTQYEEEARTKMLGLWSLQEKEVFELEVCKAMDLMSFKGTALDGIVEQIGDSGCLRIRFKNKICWTSLTGIRVPDGLENHVKNYMERRLLQRDVKVTIESTDGSLLLATVMHPAGNIAEFLVREGLAMLNWSLNQITNKNILESLILAEKQAKERKLNIWSTQIEKKEIEGKVTKILSGDTFLIDDVKVSLSSIKIAKDNEQIQFEAREYLRKLIGKNVFAKVDYIRPAHNQYQEQICVSVDDIQERMVKLGLCSVLSHGRNQDRATNYNLLLELEQEAKQKKLGLHGPIKEKKITNPKEMLGKTVLGIIEHVISATKMILYFPKEQLKATCCISKIRPTQDEEVSKQAFEFMTSFATQRDCVCFLETFDKNCFAGCLEVNQVNLAHILLENGFAILYSKTPILEEIELKAKSLKRGLWKNDEFKIQKHASYVCISEYLDPYNFYIQSMADQDVQSLTDLMLEITNFEFEPLKKIKKNELLIALYSGDESFYRAKALKITETGVFVLFIDYGNSEFCKFEDCREMPLNFCCIPPKAFEAKLTYVSPSNFQEKFKALTINKKLLANIDVTSPLQLTLFDVEKARKNQSVIGLDISTSINHQLLLEGLGFLDTDFVVNLPSDFIEPLEQAVISAKKNRLGVWKY